MSNPNPNTYQSLRQAIGNAIAGRTRKKQAQISEEPVTTSTQFSVEEHTFYNGQEVQTVENSKHYLLDCGCRVSSPNEIRGICPACARSLLARLGRRRRFICLTHAMCMACRAKYLKKRRGTSVLQKLLAVALWPLFDVTNHDENP